MRDMRDGPLKVTPDDGVQHTGGLHQKKQRQKAVAGFPTFENNQQKNSKRYQLKYRECIYNILNVQGIFPKNTISQGM